MGNVKSRPARFLLLPVAALFLWGASYTEVGGGVGAGRYSTGACARHEIQYGELGGYVTFRQNHLRLDGRVSYATQGRRIELDPGTGQSAEPENIPPRNLVAANALFGGEWKWGAFAAGLIGSNGMEFFNGESPIFASARVRLGPDFLHASGSFLDGTLPITDAASMQVGLESTNDLPVDIFVGLRGGPGNNTGPALTIGRLFDDTVYARISASVGPSRTHETGDALGYTAGLTLGYRIPGLADDEEEE